MDREDEILTPRLRLRRWQPRDERAMAGINRDPEVTRYLNRPVSPQAVAAFYELVAEHWATHGFGFWALEGRDADLKGQFIGFAGIAYPTFLPELAARPEIGWRLTYRAWGRGLATEAALAARTYGFETLNLPELISIIHPENTRSQRVATKLEMTIVQHVHNPALNRQVQVWQSNITRPVGEQRGQIETADETGPLDAVLSSRGLKPAQFPSPVGRHSRLAQKRPIGKMRTRLDKPRVPTVHLRLDLYVGDKTRASLPGGGRLVTRASLNRLAWRPALRQVRISLVQSVELS